MISEQEVKWPQAGGVRLWSIKFLQRHAASVILAEYGPVGCKVFKIAKHSGLKLIVHFHGFDASLLLKNYRMVNEYKNLFVHAAGVAVPSQFLGLNLEAAGCPREKIHVIPYGVDCQKFTVGGYPLGVQKVPCCRTVGEQELAGPHSARVFGRCGSVC